MSERKTGSAWGRMGMTFFSVMMGRGCFSAKARGVAAAPGFDADSGVGIGFELRALHPNELHRGKRGEVPGDPLDQRFLQVDVAAGGFIADRLHDEVVVEDVVEDVLTGVFGTANPDVRFKGDLLQAAAFTFVRADGAGKGEAAKQNASAGDITKGGLDGKEFSF